MSTPRRALMLLNPNARRGNARLDPALAELAAAGIDVQQETFEDATEVSADIERRCAGMDMIIVCGGDGTLNAAAKGVIAAGLPLGVLPMGTANDLARTLAIPTDLARAAEVIAAGHTRRIDVGEVNGHPFFNVASMGLSAELARSLTPQTKQRWGKLGYAVAAARVLLAARPFAATITSREGRVTVRTLQIAVGNGRHYGGGNVVETTAAIDDQRLDLYSLELRDVWKLPLMLPAFRAGAHGERDDVRTLRSTEFHVKTRRPLPINTDGELVTFTPARFRVRPAAITVFAPPPAGT